ncbi:MAG: high frequency lysogenization protein HflD [Gammaproteobacteria bacterium]|nr:MAG: high frequency lysogenization protein HflD [Gammaproteobacteria bacterium]
MKHSNTDRTLAFAGILQALHLVQQIATGKPYDLDAFQSSLNSILLIDAPSVVDVYGGVSGVTAGLRLIQAQLISGQRIPDMELSRYLIVLLHLERKLSKRADLLDALGEGIKRAQDQTGHFTINHPNLLSNLADTYANTVSTLKPRIMVSGDPGRLTDTSVANQIRALLLAAMRSAVLWRQCGGSRLQLLLERRKLTETATALLKDNIKLH